MVLPIDRLPPANFEAEMGVLGSLILDPECIHDIRPILRSEDFYRAHHETIYRVILAVADGGLPIDLITVVEELRRINKFEEIGGHYTLIEIIESIPHSAHALYYASLVRQKAIARSVIEAAHEILRRTYSHDYSAQELVEFAERSIFAIGDRREGYQVTTIGQAVVASLDRLGQRLAGAAPGLPTGLANYDQLTGGLQKGQLVVLAARPSIGKTALALNIADHIATDRNRATLFASLEMTAEELADRALCGRAGIEGSRFASPPQPGQKGVLQDVDMAALARAAERFATSPLFISDEVAQSVSHIASMARRFRAREQLGLLVIDYLQLVEADENPHRMPRHEQVAVMTRGLKNLAKVLKIPVLLLCQLNRKAEDREDRRPRMSDLRESGAIEQDANVVLLLHRPEFYDSNDQPGLAELIVAKNRGGPTGTVKLRFNSALTQFSDDLGPPVVF